jgi:EpsI family protein
MSRGFGFAVTIVVLASTAIFLDGHQEVIVPSPPVASMPHQLATWRGTDVPLDSDILETLGKGDFLLRTYHEDSSPLSQVDLFMAYFRSQRAGDTIHSPQNCLPGSGWFPLESTRITLTLPGHGPFAVNRYLVVKGDDRTLLLYWYWAHNRGVASEYWAKFYLVSDAIRLSRGDGAMIRVSTPLRGETAEAAQRRLVAFAQELGPLINTYVPP